LTPFVFEEHPFSVASTAEHPDRMEFTIKALETSPNCSALFTRAALGIPLRRNPHRTLRRRLAV
jgi:hypothetical protein